MWEGIEEQLGLRGNSGGKNFRKQKKKEKGVGNVGVGLGNQSS